MECILIFFTYSTAEILNGYHKHLNSNIFRYHTFSTTVQLVGSCYMKDQGGGVY